MAHLRARTDLEADGYGRVRLSMALRLYGEDLRKERSSKGAEDEQTRWSDGNGRVDQKHDIEGSPKRR